MDANSATRPLALTGIGQQGAQTIHFSPIPSEQSGDSVTLTASASSGLPVNFVSTTPGVCAVPGTIASMVGVGTCSVRARQAGNDNYTAAAAVPQSFTVSQASQTVTSQSGNANYGAAAPVSQTIAVSAATQNITSDAISRK